MDPYTGSAEINGECTGQTVDPGFRRDVGLQGVHGGVLFEIRRQPTALHTRYSCTFCSEAFENSSTDALAAPSDEDEPSLQLHSGILSFIRSH